MQIEGFLKKIQASFPGLKWGTCRLLTHGWDHAVIILDEKIVFRFPKDREYQRLLKDEIRLLGYLHQRLNVGIPVYEYVSDDESFAGYNLLPGKELTRTHFQRCSLAEKRQLANQLSGFLTSLHTVPKPVIHKYRVREEDQQKEYRKLVMETKKHVFPRLKKSEVNIIQEYFAEMKDVLSHAYQNVLVHNDLTGEHLLWDRKKSKLSIIDFSDRAFSDPAVDFSGLWAFGPKFVKTVFAQYNEGKEDPLLQRSNFYYKRIPLWLMKDAQFGAQITFKDAYKMFKERFKL